MPVYTYKTGRGRMYYFKVSINGRQYCRRGFETKEDARRAECSYVATYSSNIKYPRISVLFDSYLSWYKSEFKSTSFYAISRIYNKYIYGHFRDVTIDKLNYNDFAFWHSWVDDFELSADRKNLIQGSLRECFKYCFTFFYYDCHFAQMLPSFKEKIIKPAFKSKTRVLSDSDLRRFFAAAKADNNEVMYLYLLTSFETGLRFSECRGLLVEGFSAEKSGLSVYHQVVNVGGGRYTVQATKSKSGNRFVILSKSLAQLLSSYISRNCLKPQDYLFFSPRAHNRPMGSRYIRDHIRMYINAAEIKYFTHKDFRSTRGSQLERSGMTLAEIRDYLGHSSIEVTQRYYLDAVSAGADRINELLEAAYKSVFS